jgi:glutaryl-CoA dehydrogenase
MLPGVEGLKGPLSCLNEAPPGPVTELLSGATDQVENSRLGEELLAGGDYDGDGRPDLFVGDMIARALGRSYAGVGFVVPCDVEGFSAPAIHKKMSLRASVTSELVMDDVRLPAGAVLPGVEGLKGPLLCLNEARFGIVWGVMGAARACFESALEYSKEREQFGKPIGAFQLTQKKLADMALEIEKGTLLAYHLGRMKEEGRLRPEHVSIGKLNNTREAIKVARTSRGILGANGITLEYPIMRHMMNLESVITYEGTEEVHTLVVGELLTGHRAFV